MTAQMPQTNKAREADSTGAMAKMCNIDMYRVILAVVSISFTTGWCFGWPPIRAMLESADIFKDDANESHLYEAAFSFAASSVDFGGNVASWVFGIGGPRFCVATGGVGSALSMILLFLATRFASTHSWLVFPGLVLQAIAGAHFFVGVLNFQHAFPRYGGVVIGAVVLASNVGPGLAGLQKQALDAIGELSSAGVQGMFLLQGMVYVVLTLGVICLYPKEAYVKKTVCSQDFIEDGSEVSYVLHEDSTEEDEANKGCIQRWHGIFTSLGFWGLTLLTCTVGVHVKWVASEFDSILDDRHGSPAQVQTMTAAYFTWSPLFLLGAYLLTSAVQCKVEGNLNIMLLFSCAMSAALALVNALGSLEAQLAMYVLLPITWQSLYMTATQYTALLFPNATEQVLAWGLLIGLQGLSMFLLNGLHAFAMEKGYSAANLLFANFAIAAFVVICVIELKARSDDRKTRVQVSGSRKPVGSSSHAEAKLLNNHRPPCKIQV